MLLDWYIRFRGIDEWPEAEATAISTLLVPGIEGGEGRSPDRKRIDFSYLGPDGCSHKGTVLASEGSDLFYFDVGDSFRVRISPKDSSRYFVSGAHSPEAWNANTFVFFVLLAVGSTWLILRFGHQ